MPESVYHSAFVTDTDLPTVGSYPWILYMLGM